MNKARLTILTGTQAVFAVALCASWLYAYGERFDGRLIVGTAIFAGLILAGEAFSTHINERVTVSPTDIGIIAAVVVLGPFWAVLASFPADVFVARRDWIRAAYEASHTVIIVFLSGTVFSLVADPLLIGNPQPSAELFYGALVAGTTLVVANATLYSVLLKAKYDQPFRHSWRENVQPYFFSNAVDILTAGLGVLSLVAYGPISALIVFVGSVGSQVLIHYVRQHRGRIAKLQERVSSLETALTSSNATFGAMMIQEMGRKDGYTHRHATATAVYAADIAREVKLGAATVERLRLAGLLHNIGMFGLPEELLMSAGKLNSVAQHQVGEHPARGQTVLGAVPEYGEMASWVRWHHERPDGRGYPDKLRGPWIPQEAKILAVAQAYAAMVLDGPRRPGVAPDAARRELSGAVDTQFDGLVVRAFLRILDTESEGYRMADDHRFGFPTPGGGGSREFDENRGSTVAP